MMLALKCLECPVQLFQSVCFMCELRVIVLNHLLDREQLVDGHAEDGADGSLSWKPAVFARQLHLAAHKINHILRVALVKNGECPGDSRLVRIFSQDGMS